MTKPSENSISYSFKVVVKPEHLDRLNHVNNVEYLKWVNDASEKHWAILSNDEINSKYFWVCLRHEIDYKGQAFLGDELTIKTWVGASIGVTSIRYVKVYNGQQLLASATTTWCLIDVETQKPTRIREDVLGLLT